MDPSELERRIDLDLRRLPAPTAPATFLPRVLLAARLLAARPWYQRAWRTWPGAWQAASAAALLSVIVGVGVRRPPSRRRSSRRSSAPRAISGRASRIGQLVCGSDWARSTCCGVRWCSRLSGCRGLLMIMWAACAAFGVALSRVAFGEATHS